jgi:hypothetical protein
MPMVYIGVVDGLVICMASLVWIYAAREAGRMLNLLVSFSIWAIPPVSLHHPVHQSPEDSLRQARQQIVCYQTNPDNRAWKKKLWDGYELSLGPTPHAADNPEEACTAAIYNAAGKVVYRSTGFNTRYHDATGMDIDGDGAPDVVLMTDTGGGNHCCWEIEVLSLQPKPHLVFTYNPAGAFSFRKDRDGRATLWSVEGGLIEIGYSMADRPFALMVRKVIDGKLTNVTPESCPAVFEDERFVADRSRLTDAEVARFKSVQKISENEWETSLAVSEIALQHAYCRQWEKAEKVIHSMWPAYDQARVLDVLKKEFLRIYPEATKSP